jgi:hypothetical protein
MRIGLHAILYTYSEVKDTEMKTIAKEYLVKLKKNKYNIRLSSGR